MQGENGVIRMAASDGQIASGNRMQKLSDKTMSRVAFLAS